jgi:diadenylate cyclase
MLSSIVDYFAGKSVIELFREIVDVSIVYYIVYRALLVLRGTRAMQIGIGLLLVFVLYVAAAQLHFVTLLSILGALIPGAVILIVVVVFQNDIRRGLMRMGSQPWFGFARARESQAIDEVVEASTDLARHRIGAIITFEQDANLDEFVGVNKGHVIDAAVSSELLVSIFLPEGVNKLHDGAVIIRNLRIAKAGVFFPMPESRVLDPSFGSRHRAALGITEETDAVVVVVSEERGTISFCFNGNIVGNLDGPGLRRALEGVFSPSRRRRPASAGKREPVSQRLSTAAEAPVVREEIASISERPEEPTLLSIDAEPSDTPTTRIRTTTDEPESKTPSEPPAPLRKVKGDKSEGDVTAPPAAAQPRVPIKTPLTTPMRATTTPLAARPAGSDPSGIDDEGPTPESGGGGGAT